MSTLRVFDMSIFEELKRRNVLRVGIAYLIVAWLVMQVADVVINNIEAPVWVFQIIMLVLGIGLPLVLIFAWAFEMTPEGLKKEKDVDRSQSITVHTRRKLDYTIVTVLVLALGYFIFDEYRDQVGSPITVPATSVEVQAEPEAEPAPTDPSIAVLPFTDMSPDQDQGYFSDGISEELLNLLVGVDGLKVASRTSSFTFRGSNQNLGEIARELKVDHVLEGSVRKAGNRVRITAQLIDASTDRHLWSDTFDRDLVDIFAIQDEIANAIVDALRSELGVLADSRPVSVSVATENLDAYELYLQARGLFIARDRLEESIRLFEQAVELDPEFARAWEGLGAVYAVAESWDILDREYSKLALMASHKALEINPELSMPLAVIGSKTIDLERDFIGGMAFLDRAINNDPKNATTYLWRGISWATLGFNDRAIADVKSCLELDPHYENCRRHLARYQLIAGNTESALELFQMGVESGFEGSEAPFYQPLMNSGNRLAVAYGLWARKGDDRSFPAGIILDALELPDMDHSDGLKKFLSWLEVKGENPALWSEYLMILGTYEYVAPVDFSNSWVWDPAKEKFRRSAKFKPFVRELGVTVYWRQVDFPPRCRPLDEEDFECD